MNLHLVRGDITREKTDAIVNAANETLLGGGGVDGAIHRAAGPELLEACRAIGGCPTGEVRSTPGFRLAARHVIHAVGPIWHDGKSRETELLGSCYRQALREASRLGARTIAFPAISCGVYGFPIPQACRIALQTLRQAPEADHFDEIRLVCFDEAVYECYLQLLHHRNDPS